MMISVVLWWMMLLMCVRLDLVVFVMYLKF